MSRDISPGCPETTHCPRHQRKAQYRGPFPRDRRGPLWRFRGRFLHRFLHSGLGRAGTDRSETPRGGRTASVASDGSGGWGGLLWAGSNCRASTFGFCVGMVDSSSAEPRQMPRGRPSIRCLASLSETTIERDRTHARRHTEEGQSLLRRHLRRCRPGHWEEAASLGPGGNEAQRRREGPRRRDQASPRWRARTDREAHPGRVPDRAVAADPEVPGSGQHLRLLPAQHPPSRRTGARTAAVGQAHSGRYRRVLRRVARRWLQEAQPPREGRAEGAVAQVGAPRRVLEGDRLEESSRTSRRLDRVCGQRCGL